MDVEKTLDKKTGEKKATEIWGSVCFFTSCLVYQWCVSEKQSRPSTAKASVVSHFCSAAGDQKVGETEGNDRLKQRRSIRREEGGGWGAR